MRSALTNLSGVQGPIRASCRKSDFGAPGAFSLGPLQRPVLFSREKRMGGWEAPLVEGVKIAAFGRIEKLGPLCGKTVVQLLARVKEKASFSQEVKRWQKIDIPGRRRYNKVT